MIQHLSCTFAFLIKVQQVSCMLDSYCIVFVVFYFLYNFQSVEPVVAVMTKGRQLHMVNQHQQPQQQGLDTGSSSSSSSSRDISSRAGDTVLTGSQRTLRASFYVWVNVMNLVGISSLWARCADVFTPDAGARLFGFISAGRCRYLWVSNVYGSVVS